MDEIDLVDTHGGRWRTEVPTTGRERTRGLSGRDGLAPGNAMLFQRCRSVHTFGMTFSIDVALLDRAYAVLSVVRMPPRRLLLPRPRVRHILECAAGGELRPGDRLRRGGGSERARR